MMNFYYTEQKCQVKHFFMIHFFSHFFDSWNLELKTIENVGMVLYNSAADFIALEIVNSRLRFLVGKGSNAVELVSERNVTDGKWHNVSIAYSPFTVEVAIEFPLESVFFLSVTIFSLKRFNFLI